MYVYIHIYIYNIDFSLDDYGKVYGTSLCVSSCFSEFLIQFRRYFNWLSELLGGRKMAAYGSFVAHIASGNLLENDPFIVENRLSNLT